MKQKGRDREREENQRFVKLQINALRKYFRIWGKYLLCALRNVKVSVWKSLVIIERFLRIYDLGTFDIHIMSQRGNFLEVFDVLVRIKKF